MNGTEDHGAQIDPSAPLPPGVVDVRVPECAQAPNAAISDPLAAPPRSNANGADFEEVDGADPETGTMSLHDALTGATVFMSFTRGDVTVERTFDATDSAQAESLVEELRDKLLAAGVRQSHNFPDESPSAMCTACKRRQWQVVPGETCGT